MSKIRVLPTETANRIAAGEVVERPASVVKELMENSIDADATRIAVKIENGGRKLIQVTDDGCGMDNDDAMLALEPHATSKIKQGFDIDRINTLGFRGEALPSIAGVSRFRLRTREPEASAGIEILVDGGTINDVRECGTPPGTSVTVRNLFYNLPARRKFLRTASTERGHIEEIVLLQSLARPKLGFELNVDSQSVFQMPPGRDLKTRLGMLLGRRAASDMLEVDYKEGEISVSGYIARPGVTRSNRREQRVFINARPASADTLFFALRDAYHTLVMKGRYPPVVLYVDLPPEEVDVNVHPTKREVRFRDGRQVAGVVGAALRKALRGVTGDMVPRNFSGNLSSRGGKKPLDSGNAPFQSKGGSQNSFSQSAPGSSVQGEKREDGKKEGRLSFESIDKRNGEAISPEQQKAEASESESGESTRELIRSLRIIGTVHKLYLLAESREGLVLIDHHAAHERVLFEKLLQTAESQAARSQPLLMPVTVEFSPADAALLKKNLKSFTSLGFQVEPFGGGSFIIGAVPPQLPRENIEGLMRDLFEELRSIGTAGKAWIDARQIAQAACKKAARAEDILAEPEIKRLLNDLAEAELPYTCPHGRPVMINITWHELERRFGRRN